MEDSRRLSLIVGAFVLVTLVVAGFVLLTLGSGSGLLRPRYRVVSYFENVQGLVAGAPVRLAGKDVGSVEFVTFAPLEGDLPPVRVVLQIDASVQERVRSDSVASIGTIGLLGDKYVGISMGTLSGRVLQEGDEIASVSPVDLNVAVVRGTEAIDHIASLTENVNQVVEEFGAAMGGRRIAESFTALSEIVQEVQTGDSLLHSLIYDEYEGGGVESIERSLAIFEEILKEVAEGSGLLHTLIYEPSSEQGVMLEALEAGARLNSILSKIDSGEGTLGRLLNDPTVYEDLKLLLGGAERSLVVRSLIRLSTDRDQ
jgi:phospholipid/cholesterol/gamma-HCH transport system substrate-binding protein